MNLKNVFYAVAVSLFALPALAQEGAAASYTGIAAGLCIAIAAAGGALGQGRAAAAALEGIARNPAAQNKLFVPMIIGLALMESLVIFSFIIALQLAGK